MEDQVWEIEDAICDIKAVLYSMQEGALCTLMRTMNFSSIPPKRYHKLQLLEECITDQAKEENAEELLSRLFITVKNLTTNVHSTTSDPENNTSVNSQAVALHKDLKLCGTINGSDGVSFVNIIRQIEAAIDKGYTEKEISWAVIRAIHPSQQLRGYLEGREALLLPVLRKLLRSYYKERSATELYTELTQGCQGQKEEVLDFVWRMLDLGQKVCFASQEEGATFTYNQDLVRQMTLRSIHTGLRDPAVALDLKFTLLGNPSDEDLTHAVNLVVTENEERKKKQKEGRVTKAALVTMETPENQSCISLKELQAEVVALRKELTERRKPNPRPSCQQCEQAGVRCEHCTVCGSSEHFRAGCKKRRSGNERGSAGRGNH